MSNSLDYLLDSDVIIWHLRGRKEATEMLRDLKCFLPHHVEMKPSG